MVRNRLVFALFGFVLVSALANGFSLVWRLTYLLGAGIAFAWVWAWTHSRGLAVSINQSGDRAMVGDLLRRRVQVTNTLRLPKVGLELRELSTMPGYQETMVLDIPGRESRQWAPEIACNRRGQFTIGPVEVTATDPFGIFEFRRTFGTAQRIVVYPHTHPVPDFAIAGPELPGEERLQQRTHYITQNVSTIRDYVFGDSFNRIHWPTTARSGEIMVKEFDQEPGSNVWVALDLHRDAHWTQDGQSTEEYCVTLAASIARKYLESARSVGLVAFGAVPQVVPAEKGPAQMGRLLEACAVASATGRQPLGDVLLAEATRFTRATTLLVLTSTTNLSAVSAMDFLARKGVRCVVVFIDPMTFTDRITNSPEMLARLVASSIPVYQVRRADSMPAAIEAIDTSLASKVSR